MRTIIQIGSCFGDVDGNDPVINSISNDDNVIFANLLNIFLIN